MATERRAARSAGGHATEREARRLALGAVFEADFGQRTASSVLERRLAEEGESGATADLARRIVDAVVEQRDALDARLTAAAAQYPVTQLARIDRALLRSGLAELLHCPATPTRVAIAEWVELARTYSGEPARRLLNGVLGRVAGEMADRGRDEPAAGNGKEGGSRPTGGSNRGFDL